MTAAEATVVVVGAGLGGTRVAEELRRAGHSGPLVLVGAEEYPPYDRPPLSKEMLRGIRSAADIRMKDDRFFADHDVTLRLGSPATCLDTARRRVVLDDGEALEYDRLVIATGLRARTLPGTTGLAHVHTLRSLDDCLALRKSVATAKTALVVGAGFIGCEAAASLREMDLEVCLVEPQPVPLAGVLGEEVGALIARLHLQAGIDLRCGTGIHSLVGDSTCRRARLTDGTSVAADVVIMGIGSTPATEWLAESGVELGDGVLCDERGRTNVDGVWAMGDVAAWRTSSGVRRRVEHWTNTSAQARVVARDILGKDTEDLPVHYLWTDQHGIRIQVFGDFSPHREISVVRDDGRHFLATCSADGVFIGVVGAGMAGKVARLRMSIGHPVQKVHAALC